MNNSKPQFLRSKQDSNLNFIKIMCARENSYAKMNVDIKENSRLSTFSTNSTTIINLLIIRRFIL